MFRTVFIALLVGAAGATAAVAIQPPSQRAPSSLIRTAESVRATQSQLPTALSQFRSVAWDADSSTNQNEQKIFDVFSPLVKTFAAPVTLPSVHLVSSYLISLPKKVLTIGPLGSLAKFMDTAAGGGTAAAFAGVNSLGNAHITHTNSGVLPSWFGSPLDHNGLTEYLPDTGMTVQQVIASGGTGLAMGDKQFQNLPPEFRLSANDPLVQQYVTGQGLLPGDIGLLNPQAPYVAIPDSSVPTGTRLVVTDDATGYQEVVIKVDAGPGSSTGYGIDMSPGLYQRMGNGEHSVSYAIASDQSVLPGPTNGTKIPYDQPVIGIGGGSGGGGNIGGAYEGSSRGGGGSTAYCGNDYWSEENKCCYKHTGQAGPPGQYDGVQTCNGGWAGKVGSTDDPPRKVEKCGVEGKLCNRETTIAMGGKLYSCLFTACPPNRNAIWDPDTKRCGCDDGGSGTSGIAASIGGSNLEGTGTPPPNAPAAGQGQAIPNGVSFTHDNDTAGFQTGSVVDKNGNLIPINPHIYQTLDGLSAEGDTVVVTSMVGEHQDITVSGNTSQHVGGDAIDMRNNAAAIAYVYNNREALGVYQIISADYPQYNYRDGVSNFQYSPNVLGGEQGIFHVGFLSK